MNGVSLRVSEASPKRWEAGLVQDDAMDELIRIKADLAAARKNVKQLQARISPRRALVLGRGLHR